MPIGSNGQKVVSLSPDRRTSFFGRDIVSVRQFSREDLAYLFGVADEMRGIVRRVGATDLLKGYVLANLFYEPSTRTSSSFIAAMARLGGATIPIHGVQYSSVTKG
ncbi:MAG: aspartate carbamoyltransferase, partial [Chloroflexi bacterium]|nr:aspartate carbamoyltransferase [Chloroflexota bacterium]